MPIKIDAPRAWGWVAQGQLLPEAVPGKDSDYDVRVRIVRETDYRKLMAVARAAMDTRDAKSVDAWERLDAALDKLKGKG